MPQGLQWQQATSTWTSKASGKLQPRLHLPAFGVSKECAGCRDAVNKRTGNVASGRKAKKAKIIEELDISAPCPRCHSATSPTNFRVWQPGFFNCKAVNEASGCFEFDRACLSCVSVARKGYRPSTRRAEAFPVEASETRDLAIGARIFMDQIAQLKSDMARAVKGDGG